LLGYLRALGIKDAAVVIEALSLVAFILFMLGTGAQVIAMIRKRNAHGVSASTYALLVVLGLFNILIGVQYKIISMTVLTVMIFICNCTILFLISRRVLFILIGSFAVIAILSVTFAPTFVAALRTHRWSEQVGFAYGVVASAAFFPQVLLTRRTRDVSAIAFSNYLLLSIAMVLLVVVSILVRNWSLSFWNIVLTLSLVEMLRLKIVGSRRAREAH
jgi:uncharacterized protein with PQ loop repeat